MEEWRVIQRTRGSTLKQLWARLRSGLWVPTDRFIYDGQVGPSDPLNRGLGPGTFADIDPQPALLGADADDCYSYGGAERTGESYLYHNYTNATSLISAMRFQGLTVGQGDTIGNSFLSLYGRPGVSIDLRCRFYAEDADDGSVPESSDLDALSKTTASYYWSALLSSSAFTDSPANSFNAIIQEIVSRGGWSSGNSITILGVDEQSTEECLTWDYSGDSAKAAKLHIEYTPAEPPAGVPVQMMHYMRMRKE